MSITQKEEILVGADLARLTEDHEDLTEEELEALEDAEDLAIAKERYATMDRSELIVAGTARAATEGTVV